MILVLKHNFQKVFNRVFTVLKYIWLLMYLVLWKYTLNAHSWRMAIAKTSVLLIDVSPGDTKKVYNIDYGSAKN